ncbi:hypothetical protein V2J09_020778 [Rumex salicifolius]
MASDLQNMNRLHKEGEEEVSMASAVSDDVLVHIFLKLPVNYLLRCRCVCKSWCSLISGPMFVSAHRNHIASAGAGEIHTFITRRCDPGTRKLRYTLHSDDESLEEIAEFDFPSPNPSEFSRILGSVNGLICLLDLNHSLMLWNPTIRKALILANPTVDIAIPSLPHFGFGFDPLADDYKIVRIVYGVSGICVDIFKLSSRSWSTIDLGANTLPSLYPRQAYLNGVVHWLAYDSVIVGFDLNTEKFVMYNLPDDLKDKRMEDVAIAAYCGSLALFELETSKSIGLWVMNKYGADKTWTRQCVISFPYFSRRVKGIAINGKILVEDFFGLLFWFDPATRRSEDLAIRDIGDVSMFHLKAHAESLVLLGLKDESIGFDSLEKQDVEGSTDKGKKLRLCVSEDVRFGDLTGSWPKKAEKMKEEQAIEINYVSRQRMMMITHSHSISVCISLVSADKLAANTTANEEKLETVRQSAYWRNFDQSEHENQLGFELDTNQDLSVFNF